MSVALPTQGMGTGDEYLLTTCEDASLNSLGQESELDAGFPHAS